MSSVPEITDLECGKNPGHPDFIPLAEFTPRCLPIEYRSQRNWALIHMKAILAVKLMVKEDSGSGCITAVEDSERDEIKLTVRTAVHLGYKKMQPASTTVNIFVPYTDTVLESTNVKLKDVFEVDDIATLGVTFERHIFTHLGCDKIITNIHTALKPDSYTLWAYVLEKYQTVKMSLSSFLKDEISCIKHKEFAPGNSDVFKMHLQVEHVYMIDVILFIHAFASHPEDMTILLRKLAAGSNSETGERRSPVTVVSSEICAKQSAVLDKLQTHLYKSLSESVIDEINDCLSCLFPFKICVEQAESNLMIMLVGSTALLEHRSMEERLEIGQDLQNLEAPGKAKTRNRRDKVEGPQPPDVGLDANKLKEEQTRSSPFLEVRNKTFAEIYSEQMVNKDGLECVHFKPLQEGHFYKPNTEGTLAVLISYPHGKQPQRITIGFVERSHDCEVFYTTPSCDGSSGGPVWLIQRKPTSSVGHLEDIDFATHSSGGEKCGTGILYEFEKKKKSSS